MMKIIPYLLLASLLFCRSTDIKVVKATSQKWHGGRQGSIGGTRFSFQVIAGKSSDKLTIDQLWVRDEYIGIRKVLTTKGKNATNFAKNDTLMIRSEIFIKSEVSKEIEKNTPSKDSVVTVPLPYQYKGAAMLGYLVGGKRKYLEVDAFEVLEVLNYP